MANRTIDLWMNVLFFLEPCSELKLVLADIFGLPVELRNELDRSQMRLGMTVAIDAPRHRLILVLVDDFHFVDSTMASNARNTACDVGRVIEIDVVGKPMNPDPIDRLTSSPTVMNRLEPGAGRVNSGINGRAVLSHWTMTVNACLRSRYCRMSRFVDRVVTVTAVHLQLAGVYDVAERNGLRRLITGIEGHRTCRP